MGYQLHSLTGDGIYEDRVLRSMDRSTKKPFPHSLPGIKERLPSPRINGLPVGGNVMNIQGTASTLSKGHGGRRCAQCPKHHLSPHGWDVKGKDTRVISSMASSGKAL